MLNKFLCCAMPRKRRGLRLQRKRFYAQVSRIFLTKNGQFLTKSPHLWILTRELTRKTRLSGDVSPELGVLNFELGIILGFACDCELSNVNQLWFSGNVHLTAHRGTFVIHSCSRYPDIEKRRPCKPGLSVINWRKDFRERSFIFLENIVTDKNLLRWCLW